MTTLETEMKKAETKKAAKMQNVSAVSDLELFLPEDIVNISQGEAGRNSQSFIYLGKREDRVRFLGVNFNGVGCLGIILDIPVTAIKETKNGEFVIPYTEQDLELYSLEKRPELAAVLKDGGLIL